MPQTGHEHSSPCIPPDTVNVYMLAYLTIKAIIATSNLTIRAIIATRRKNLALYIVYKLERNR